MAVNQSNVFHEALSILMLKFLWTCNYQFNKKYENMNWICVALYIRTILILSNSIRGLFPITKYNRFDALWDWNGETDETDALWDTFYVF